MIRLSLALFLLAHGLLHPAIYAIPAKPDDKQPFDPGHSWALSGLGVAARSARLSAVAVSAVTAALYVVAAVALLSGATAWAGLAVSGAVVGLLLKVGYFHPWLTIGVALDVGILAAVAAGWPPSLY